MKNYQPSIHKATLFRDYEKVKSVIEHPDNKEIHTEAIFRTVSAFWRFHGSSDYYNDLYKRILELEEKFFDERMFNLQNKLNENRSN